MFLNYSVSKMIFIIFFGLLIICIILFLIIILYRKLSIRKIASFLIFPRPIIGLPILNILAKIANHDNLVNIIQLRKNIEKRFGSINSIPIYLCIDGKYRFTSPEVIMQHTENISWIITNKFALVQVSITYFEEILCCLFDVFESQACDCIIVSCNELNSEYIQKIKGLLQLHQTLTNDNVSVFLINNINSFKYTSIINNINHDQPIGFNCQNDTYINFLKETQNNILLNISEDYFISAFIKYIINEQNNIENITNILSQYNLTGFYFTIQDINQKHLFIENLFNNIIYISCKKTDFFVNQHNYYASKVNQNRKEKIYSFMTLLLLIILCIFVSYVFFSLKKTYQNIQNALQIGRVITKNNSHTLEKINTIGLNHFGFITQLIMKKEIEVLKKLRNFFIFNGGILLKNDFTLNNNNDIFVLSPIFTTNFQLLNNNIKTLCNTFSDFYMFLKQEKIVNKFHEKLNQYEEHTKEKIMSNFKTFFTTFNNCIIINKINNLNQNMNTIFYSDNCTLSDITKLIDSISELKIACHINNNIWWIQNNLDISYKKLIETVKKTPIIGNELSTQIEDQRMLTTKVIKDQIMNSEHLFCGCFLDMKQDTIILSDNLSKLYNFLRNIINEPIIKSNYESVQLIVPKIDDICLFDLDILDKIIIYLEQRNNFKNTIANANVKIRHTLQDVVDNNLKRFIIFSVKESQIINNNTLNMEQIAINLNETYKRIVKIYAFCKINLKSIPHEIDYILKDTMNKLISNIRYEMNNSILTCYKYINQWDGESHIVNFLFQCQPDELNETISNGLAILKNIYNSTLLLLTDKRQLCSKNNWDFIQDLSNQIKYYIGGQRNQISELEGLLLSLKKWEIKWRQNIKINSLNFNFFDLCYKQLNYALISKTNQIVLSRSNQNFDKIKSYFNKYIKNKFPFGNGDNVEVQFLIEFLELYKENRKDLINDKNFLNNENLQKIKRLDSLLDIFEINNGHLFMNLNIEYHVKEAGAKNANLILSYLNYFGEQRFNTDIVSVKTKINDMYKLEIAIAPSSVMHLKPSVIATIKNNCIIFNFMESFSFLKFLDLFFYKRDDNCIIVKIIIQIKNHQGQDDEIITFIKAKGIPIFIKDL